MADKKTPPKKSSAKDDLDALDSLRARLEAASTKQNYSKLESMFAEASKQGVYPELVYYLAERGGFPESAYDIYNMPSGLSGSYSYRIDQPESRGKLKFNERSDTNTMLHEISHAAHRALTKQYEDTVRAGVKNPFTDAYEKFSPQDMARIINPSWYEKTRQESDGYRTNPKEMVGFGMGNTTGKVGMDPEKGWAAAQHIDPTIATNFRVLLDLGRRFPAPVKEVK
jgi:hypothetical protein